VKDIHLLPSADTGDWSDGITVTVTSSVESPLNNNVTEIEPDASEPLKVD